MKSFKDLMAEAKATYCGRCGTTHIPPSQGGTCPALKNEETEQIEEKLTDDAKKKIQTALGPKFSNNTLRQTSGPARAIIGLAKTNPDNIVKKEEVEKIDELSKATLTSYRDQTKEKRKAYNDAIRHVGMSGGDDKRVSDWSKEHDRLGGKIKIANRKIKNKDGVSEEIEMNEAETPNLPGKATHLTTKDVRHPEHGIISGSTTLRHLDGDNYEVRAGRAKGKTISLDKQHVQKMNEETQQGDTMSMMEQYLAAIEGKTDFRSGLVEKTLTPAEKKKREEVAQAIERDNPEMPMDKKMAIATSTAKKVAEETVEEQTHPKTDKEKDLAKLAPPHDKITHADVMVGRGVKKEGVMDTVKKIGKKVIDTVAPGDEALLKDLQKKVGVPQTGKKPTAEELSSKEKMKRGMYNKEETEVSEAMISYGDFMSKIKAHKAAGNKVVDDKYTDKKAEYTSIDGDGVGRKVIHTHTGQKMENLGQVEKRDDDETKTTEKRGRGRPAGSKSGARN